MSWLWTFIKAFLCNECVNGARFLNVFVQRLKWKRLKYFLGPYSFFHWIAAVMGSFLLWRRYLYWTQAAKASKAFISSNRYEKIWCFVSQRTENLCQDAHSLTTITWLTLSPLLYMDCSGDIFSKRVPTWEHCSLLWHW